MQSAVPFRRINFISLVKWIVHVSLKTTHKSAIQSGTIPNIFLGANLNPKTFSKGPVEILRPFQGIFTTGTYINSLECSYKGNNICLKCLIHVLACFWLWYKIIKELINHIEFFRIKIHLTMSFQTCKLIFVILLKKKII